MLTTLTANIMTNNINTAKIMANKIKTKFFEIRQILAVKLISIFHPLKFYNANNKIITYFTNKII